MHRLLTALSLAAFLTACATHHEAILSKPIIQSIAIIPASNPTWYTLENVAAPISGVLFLATKLDSKGKAKSFNHTLQSRPSTLGTDFTNEVAAALRADGFVVEILESVKRPTD